MAMINGNGSRVFKILTVISLTGLLSACNMSSTVSNSNQPSEKISASGLNESVAGDVLVLTVKSDSSGTYELSAVVDDAYNVTGLRVVNGSSRKFFDLEKLNEGVALYTKKRGIISKDVIRMNIENFSPSQGGKAVLTLLRQYSVLGRDDYRTYEMQVQRGQDNSWKASRLVAGQTIIVDGLNFGTRINDGSEVGIESVAASIANNEIEKVNTADLPQAEDQLDGNEEFSYTTTHCGRFLI